MLRDYIGNKRFYKRIMALALPIMIQNGITQFVNMLDNVMVGATGTVPMTGVAITNQLLFVFNLCVFGAVSGAGIFGAQFFGNKDREGVRHTFRFKLIFCTILCAVGILVFALAGDPLVSLYLKGEGDPADALAALGYAREYLWVMLIGLFPYTIAQCYSSTMRECGKSLVPMVSGVSAVGVNLVFNYILIFGKLGAPALGVKGAAIATVLSRFVELGILIVWTRLHKEDYPYFVGAYRSLYVPPRLVGQIFAKGLPLMFNETFWALGMATLNQCYSLRGLDVVAANNICQTFSNVFMVVFQAVGVAIGIHLGHRLGAGHMRRAAADARRLIAFSVLVSLVVSVVFAVSAQWIPLIYNTTPEVRAMASSLMRITAAVFVFDAFANASYFTLRSGGQTFITILFDSCFTWVICVPVALILSQGTDLPILGLYAVVQSLNFIKCVLGYIMVKRGYWLRTIVQ